jgi:transcriptional regulator with XRE-family HTH domain
MINCVPADPSSNAMSPVAWALGTVLRQHRTGRQWTRQELAGRLTTVDGEDVAMQTVATWELGTRRLSVERLYGIAQVYGMRPAELVAEVDELLLGRPGTVVVNLVVAAGTAVPELRPLARWAAVRCAERRLRAVLTPTSLIVLAQLCSLPPSELAGLLHRIGATS